jgi:ankyrin repeat protein
MRVSAAIGVSALILVAASSVVRADTPLIDAVLKGDRAVVERLLKSGADVNAANEYGATALYAASADGRTAIVRLLLDAKADPNAALLSGETPLMAAVDDGHIDVARALIERGADVNRQETRGGQTALMWAAANRYAELVALLIEHGADLRARSKGDFTALLFAAQQGDEASGRILLQAGADANDVRSRDRMTALMIATASGQTAFATLLMDQGANVNLVDSSGYSALHYAALELQGATLVRALVGRGANPNARSTRDTRENTTSGVSLNGATPLFLAASKGHVDTVRALLAGNADPSITTDNGTAPLHVASWGGDPNFRDWSEEEKKNLFEVTRLLVELGGDVNSAGEHGWTALHGAAYKGVDAAVQFLIDRGARTEVFDEYGQTPLSIATTIITVRSNDAYYQSSRIFRKSTVELLLKLGARPLDESGVDVLGQFYNRP